MAKRRKRRKRRQNNMLVLRLLVLVVLVLVVFEGKLIHTMFSQAGGGSVNVETNVEENVDEAVTETTDDTAPEVTVPVSSSGTSTVLAGLPSGNSANPQTEAETEPPVSAEVTESPAVVQEREPSVDDSYFSDAVFIGDSRMEGFRNTSGITQGTFLTAVGLSISSLSQTKIATADGNITVYQGLSGRQYSKIYLMLGTNDLGYYPWDNFQSDFENMLTNFHQLQPNATIYVCSCIYVEESKVTTGDYVNNENVQKINGYMLSSCEALDYAWYLNLNEVLGNGYHSLIEGASADGIHLYEDYSKLMLEYMKSHYLDVAPVEDVTEAMTEE